MGKSAQQAFKPIIRSSKMSTRASKESGPAIDKLVVCGWCNGYLLVAWRMPLSLIPCFSASCHLYRLAI